MVELLLLFIRELYSKKVEDFVVKHIKDETTAKDITQEIFLKISDNLKYGKYEESEKFPNWMMKIAKNKLIDYTRKGRNARDVTMLLPEQTTDDEFGGIAIKDVASPDENPADVLIREYDYAVLAKLFDKIPKEQAETIKRKLDTGESFRGIADDEGILESTVKTRYFSGLRKLKSILENTKTSAA